MAYQVQYYIATKPNAITLNDGKSLSNTISLLENHPNCTDYYVYCNGKTMTRKSLGNPTLTKLREVK